MPDIVSLCEFREHHAIRDPDGPGAKDQYDEEETAHILAIEMWNGNDTVARERFGRAVQARSQVGIVF
ncbi:hypothetical protein NW754_003197 [Fusarium falciforme]|nr:hypothetical protein NW754_003197 [Fusarium falciforme]